MTTAAWQSLPKIALKRQTPARHFAAISTNSLPLFLGLLDAAQISTDDPVHVPLHSKSLFFRPYSLRSICDTYGNQGT